MGGTRAEKEVYFEKLKVLVETYREWCLSGAVLCCIT
jgi:hypothetical protein